jgi:Na+-transporting NADH:ubiquinone oxidoreductase subunit NqrD
MNTLLDYLANSSRGPLVVALGVGLAVLMLVTTLFPDAGKGHDPALLMLLAFGAPMAITAVGLMIWARRWRKQRAMRKS